MSYTSNSSILLLEQLIANKLPDEYKEFLELFTNFLIAEEKKDTGNIFYFDPIKALLEKEQIKKDEDIYYFEKLRYLVKEDSLTTENVSCHSNNSFIEIERINSSIIIAGYDGVYLYFDPLDNFSVWEFWLDDGSVGKIADNFKDFLSQYDIEYAE
ncbi:hypothetical protein GCM10022422_41130 [Flavobacterium ginsengisoli]|uniref:Knr4/Smi1-like domain-containing protein n=1 Tax=Flavobacterium ginsengisoli TaxID=871694 RepID=A0ABP7FYN6_9FLAO|nr:SMI1/KNR4 family protein [Flavobacterium ginsengisoli]